MVEIVPWAIQVRFVFVRKDGRENDVNGYHPFATTILVEVMVIVLYLVRVTNAIATLVGREPSVIIISTIVHPILVHMVPVRTK